MASLIPAWPSANPGIRDRWEAKGCGCVTIHALDPDSRPAFERFLHQLSDQSRASRFMAAMRRVPADLVQFLASANQRDHIAWVVEPCADPGVVIAEARYKAAGKEAELALAVADAWQGRGLGTDLMRRLLRQARASGIRRIWGHIRADNDAMIAVAHRTGFTVRAAPEDPQVVLAEKLLGERMATRGTDREVPKPMPSGAWLARIAVATRWLRANWISALIVAVVPGGGLIAVGRAFLATRHARAWVRAYDGFRSRHDRRAALSHAGELIRRVLPGHGADSITIMDSDPYLIRLVTDISLSRRPADAVTPATSAVV